MNGEGIMNGFIILLKKALGHIFFQNHGKRSFYRVAGHNLLTVKYGDNEKVLTFTKDISSGGILFFSDKNIQVGTLLDLAINLKGCFTIVKAKAKVVRSRPLKGGNKYEIGAQYTYIDRVGMEYIERKALGCVKKNRKDKKKCKDIKLSEDSREGFL